MSIELESILSDAKVSTRINNNIVTKKLSEWFAALNLSFGNSASRNVGTTSGTVAAGDDSRIVGAMQRSANGSDIPDKQAFRNALQLGDSATKTIGQTAGTVAAGDDPRFGMGGSGNSVVKFGAVGDGVVECYSAMVAAITEALSFPGGGIVLIPAGKYKISQRINVTIPAGKSLTFLGEGPNASELYFPTGEGTQFTYGDPNSSLSMADMSLTTATQGTGNPAVRCVYPVYYGNPASTGQNEIRNVTIRGSDGYTQQNSWVVGYDLVNVNNFNFIGGMVASSGTRKGDGVWINGIPELESYAVQINFTGTTFLWTWIGIKIGHWWQGITVNQVNFTGGVWGILVPQGSGGDLVQLSVTNSQFGLQAPYGPGTGGCSIDLQERVSCFNCTNNALGATPGQAAVRGYMLTFSICSNYIGGTQVNGNLGDIGIEILGAHGNGTITGNSFTSLGVGIFVHQGMGAPLKIEANSRLYLGQYIGGLGVNWSTGCRTDEDIYMRGRVQTSQNINLPANTDVGVRWTELEDIGGLHEEGDFPNRITIARSGLYEVSASVLFSQASSGTAFLTLVKNLDQTGMPQVAHPFVDGTQGMALALTGTILCNAGDILQVIAKTTINHSIVAGSGHISVRKVS